MPVDAAGPAQWAGGVWRSAACASNQECLSLKGGAQPSCCSRWLRRRLQPCAGTAAVHGDATASSRRRPRSLTARRQRGARAPVNGGRRRFFSEGARRCSLSLGIIWLRVTRHDQPRLRELREKKRRSCQTCTVPVAHIAFSGKHPFYTQHHPHFYCH